MLHQLLLFFFFFNDTATTEIYTLSLHDALPISMTRRSGEAARHSRRRSGGAPTAACQCRRSSTSLAPALRSEEHTSELQSQSNLVCRLLLEKKKSSCRCCWR